MPIFDTIINSATTLSIRPRPGENKRLLDSKSEAIFTFGDFTIDKSYTTNYLSGDTHALQFGGFDNLETLNAVNLTTNISIPFVQHNELNLPKKEPKSHAYFSSFYTSVASSINNIISNFPYAILSYNDGNINIFDYAEDYNAVTHEKKCNFKIPISGLTNQSNIALTSANTSNNFSLSYDYEKFSIQLSGKTDVFKIKNYSLSGTYLYFEIYGFLKHDNPVSTHVDALYIRPTIERMFNYNDSITALETQLLNDGILLIPSIDTVKDDSFEQTFIWPRTIDGFSPDSYGPAFESYRDRLLNEAEKVDEEKTDIFIKTIIPENYLEYDSNGQIYRSIIQTYASEFDKLKNYIDAIAYAHSVDYNDEETAPKKFLTKLSTLLGWKLSNSFSELDLFDYLTSDLDTKSNSYSYFNVEIWKRVLVNLVWLYKKKGTRDAIMFIFRLLGAPDCLINLNEFVYDIIKSNNDSLKVRDDGFINYESSEYAFQEGGNGRGNGNSYIQQWVPEFNPILRLDNNKIEVGDPTIGTRNIMNTKEMQIGFSPDKAIECDIFSFYKNSGSCWNWGSYAPPYSCLTVPFEYLTFSCDDVAPVNVTAMTLNQYIDYVYTNSIDPISRKTNTQCNTTWGYPELQNIYLAYYYTTCEEAKNNNLTMCKLEAYLQLLEVQLGSYISQLIPSTTIFEGGVATMYKNTVFNRQRFVYKEGVDKGSMFQRDLTERIHPTINYPNLNGKINNIATAKNAIIKVTGKKTNDLSCDIIKQTIKFCYVTTKNTKISTFKITCGINKNYTKTNIEMTKMPNGNISGTDGTFVTEEIITL